MHSRCNAHGAKTLRFGCVNDSIWSSSVQIEELPAVFPFQTPTWTYISIYADTLSPGTCLCIPQMPQLFHSHLNICLRRGVPRTGLLSQVLRHLSYLSQMLLTGSLGSGCLGSKVFSFLISFFQLKLTLSFFISVWKPRNEDAHRKQS